MKTHILMAVYTPIEEDGRVKRACEALAGRYDLTLLCLEPSRGERFQGPGYAIIRAPQGRGGRIRRQMTFWAAFVRLARDTKPAGVYAHDYFLPFPGWLAARLSGARFVYDAHELFIPEGQRTSLREKFFYRLERFCLPRADLVIAANPERARVMREHFRLATEPTAIRNIPPIPSSQLADSEIQQMYPGLRKTQSADFHVAYMGAMDMMRGIGVLLDAMEYLPAHVKMVFVGGGPDLPKLRKLAEVRSDDRLRVIGPIPHAHVIDALRQADMGYLSYAMDLVNNMLCAPNKVFEYAQAGLPMVATCQPTIRALFEEHPIGRLVGCSGAVTPEEVSGAVQEILSEPERYRRHLAAFLTEKTWEHEAARLQRVVGALLG